MKCYSVSMTHFDLLTCFTVSEGITVRAENGAKLNIYDITILDEDTTSDKYIMLQVTITHGYNEKQIELQGDGIEITSYKFAKDEHSRATKTYLLKAKKGTIIKVLLKGLNERVIYIATDPVEVLTQEEFEEG